MEKRPKTVSRAMRERLLVNRDGKLTVDQWKDIVTEPLATLLLLLVPGFIILGPRLVTFGLWGWSILLGVIALVWLLPVLFRARRYARAAVRCHTFYTGNEIQTPLRFWQSVTLYTDSGKLVRFNKRLAPYPALERNHAYLVYYLEEPGSRILLSIAPTDHPDAERWQPTPEFERRLSQRG